MALTKISTAMISQSASAVDLNIDAGTLYVDATNNRVGVGGKTDPDTPLHVTGTVTATLFAGSGASLTGIPNGALTNSSITINSSATSLGGSITLTTANIAENTNLYYTNARADARIAAADTNDLSEGSSNLYYTDARVDARVAGGSLGNITTTGYIRGPATFTIDPATHADNTGTVVIAGNLQVDGTQTTINSTTLTVDDKNITLASGSANASAASGAGFTVDIGSGTNPSITYDGTNDEWDFNKPLNVTGAITSTALTVSTSQYQKIVSYFSSPYTSGFKFSDLNGGIWYNAGTDDLYVSAGHANSKLILVSGGSTALTLLSDQSAVFAGAATFNSSVTVGGNVDFGDLDMARFGVGNDLQIFHNGTDNFIKNATSNQDLFIQGNDGGNIINALQLDMSQAGRATFNEGIVCKTSAAGDFGVNINTPAGDSMKLQVVDTGSAGAAHGSISVSDGDLTLDVAGDIILDADGEDIRFKDGGVQTFVFTMGSGSTISTPRGNLTLDVAGDIILNADGGDVIFSDGATPIADFENSGSNFKISSLVQDKDLILGGNYSGSFISALTLDMSDAGTAIFNHDANFSDNAYINLGSGSDLSLNSDGTNGRIFADNGNLTLDVAGDIILDADGGDIKLKDGGVEFGAIYTNGTDLFIQSMVNSGDLYLSGKDSSGNGVNALTLDMSDGGDAYFAKNIHATSAFLTKTNNDPNLTLITTDADANAGPLLVLDRNSASPADGDVLGQISFNGKNDAAEAHNYAKIEARIVDASNATEDGRLELMTSVATEEGISRILMNATETVVNDNSKDLDFRVESDGNANMLFVDGGNNQVGIGTSSMNSYYSKELVVSAAAEGGITIVGGSSDSQYLMFADGTSGTQRYSGYVQYAHSSDTLILATGANSVVNLSPSESVMNEQGLNRDFRVESDGLSHMLFVDASANIIGVNTSAPQRYVNTGGLVINATDFGRANNIASGNNLAQTRYWNDTGSNVYEIARDRVNVGAGQVNRGEYQFAVNNGASLRQWLDVDYLGNVRFNEGGYDSDFRVESNANTHMLFVDGGEDRVGIGMTPISRLSVKSNGNNDVVGVQMSGNTVNIVSLGQSNDHGQIVLRQNNGVVQHNITATDGVVFNEGGIDQDFRVESDSNTHMLFVDGGNNNLAIGNTVVNIASGFDAQAGFGYAASGQVQIAATSNLATLVLGQNQGTNGSILDFRKQGTVVGTISVTGSSTAYNTSSDARLKDVTGEARGLEVINALNPVAYNWKADGKADEGLIAQEVLDIVPNAVSGSEEDMYSMDYSKLVTPLIKAIQEQQTQIEELKKEVKELKSNG